MHQMYRKCVANDVAGCGCRLHPSKFTENKVLLSQSADGSVTVPHVTHLYIYSAKDLLEKKNATMSKSAECCAAFVPGGTQVTQNQPPETGIGGAATKK